MSVETVQQTAKKQQPVRSASEAKQEPSYGINGNRGAISSGESKAFGLIRAYDQSKPLSKSQEAELEIVDTLARKYGFEVTVRDTLDKGANGVYYGGTNKIEIALDNKSEAYSYIMVHEMLHIISIESPESYEILKDYVKGELANAEGFNFDDRMLEKREYTPKHCRTKR